MAPRKLLTRSAVAAMTLTLLIGSAEGAGPWKGQIVDRETGQPIPGAVVLAIWTVRSWGEIHPEDQFHRAFEAVSDGEGRFVIPEHTAVPTKPLTAIRGPQIVIFKAGFGAWEFQGSPHYEVAEEGSAREQRIRRSWEAFEKEGVVFQLRRHVDVRARSDWLGRVRPLSVPDDKMPWFLDALDDEAISLGRSPARTPRPRGH
jgi:hypothetical protein